ncbi:hypothetical protein K469DRAFT_739996 [Zopfia rhizophila CBS 207.26]|uniref:BAG domain-containing protein n=1 Tax=Zopfia rhizophila CBS 207.26 TaxID=1314779 RepID=A0A6A6DY96_9PEZI|nr:hypothetical protein K469DRAFT_739996 [Zopfia rhizophila CBS 207.26]
MPTWGRGGAGNIVSEAQIKERNRTIVEDLEANRPLASSAAPPATSAPSQPQEYAHMGRGGAGNWYQPTELENEGSFNQPSDSTSVPTSSKPQVSTPWHPDNQELPVARSGRGGAGNFVWKDEEKEKQRAADEEKIKEKVTEKRSPTPSTGSNSGCETAQSATPPPQPERLPSVAENNEPVSQIPQNITDVKAQPVSQLPQPATAATPLKSKASKFSLTAITTRTPKNQTPIKPAGEEMHPHHHQASTAKILDEARWLGFQALGSHTAPPKASDGFGIGQATPSKTPIPTTTSKLSSIIRSPEFRFRFRSPMPGLSPKSSRILNGDKEEKSVAGSRTIFGADEFSTPADVSPQRKIAVPKGISARFSEVHMAQFKKMDSIANHPSAFRADPSRFKFVNKSLKRSPSKAELDKPEPAAKGPITSLKRTLSKMDMTQPVSKTPATSLKRTQSKMDMAQPNTNLPRAQSTVRLVPPSRDGRPLTQDGNRSAKRMKRNENDDAASTRPISQDSKVETRRPATPGRPLRSQTGLPRVASRLMTPTKSSLVRSQSIKAVKSASTIPSLLRSPSTRTLFSATNIGETMKEGFQEGIRKTSNSLHRVKSILRTPTRKFSDDPEKIAAGTHISPPPGLNFNKALPSVPVTAPVRKHVNFTTSILEKAAQDELGKSHSPLKFRVGSEALSGAVVYPALQSSVEYPTLPTDEELPAASPARRLTFGGAPETMPGQFLFQSDKSMKFGSATKGTIRMVRKSDASSFADGKKRKLEAFEETSDKENNQLEDEGRSPKKVRANPAEPPKTPASRLPSRPPKRPALLHENACRTFTVASINNLIDDLKKSFHFFKNHPLLGTTSSPPLYIASEPPKGLLSRFYLQIFRFLQRSGVTDLTDFVTIPRFDDPTYLTSLAILLAAVFITMSWFSRAGGSWSGRFSPFGRPSNSPNEVSDADFSYITSEDLATHQNETRHRSASRAGAGPEIVDWDDKNPDRDTDVVIFKHGRVSYPTHFPAQSIRDGDLTIGSVRQAAAKKLGINDPRRIRMFYKGRNLKFDERTAREEGLRGDGNGGEILCVIGEANVGGMAPGSEEVDGGIPGRAQHAWSDGSDEEDDTEGISDSGSGAAIKKKPRKRGGKKSKKGKKSSNAYATASSTNLPSYSNSTASGVEFLPIPSHIPTPRPTSAPPTTKPSAATPQTPLGKLDALASKFHTEHVPLCIEYMRNPPEDKSVRDLEHRKLSETIMTQILLKLDGVETEGDQDARARRKELVKEVNGMLNRLDEVVK